MYTSSWDSGFLLTDGIKPFQNPMWAQGAPHNPGIYWVKFKTDPRVFRIALTRTGTQLRYSIYHREWGKTLDERDYEEMLTIFGGVDTYMDGELPEPGPTPSES